VIAPRHVPATALAAVVAVVAASLLAGCAPADGPDAGARAADVDGVATLPPAIAELLALDAVLDDAHLRARPAHECRTTVDVERRQLRRTINTRTADGATRIVFVRAAPADSALQRVEVVHKPAGGAQTGVTWNARDGAVRVVRYAAPGAAPDSAAAASGAASYDPAAVASRMRELGGRALALRCAEGSGGTG